MIDEAEMSESSDSNFGDIVPPTPPPGTPPPPLPLPPLNPPPVVDDQIKNEQEPAVQTDSDEDYLEEEEDDDESDEEFSTLKEYYAHAVGKTDHEKYYIMFCDHVKNIIGGCKKERQAILHAQHVRRIHDHLDPDSKDTNFESRWWIERLEEMGQATLRQKRNATGLSQELPFVPLKIL